MKRAQAAMGGARPNLFSSLSMRRLRCYQKDKEDEDKKLATEADISNLSDLRIIFQRLAFIPQGKASGNPEISFISKT
ncbi:MAG: hypothetical protein ING08_00455 [Roseomonas sp.]|nr:hypothetical protein [Roseomonas sp.]MCA3378692.1 hypothetical protein [Roseomonas sp.]